MSTVYRSHRGDCPRCQSTLNPFDEHGARALRCVACEGTFFSNDLMSRVYGALVVHMHATPSAIPLASLRCPTCHQAMRRAAIAVDHGSVLVDSCNAHGAWFDREEFDRLLDLATRPAKG